MASKRASEPPPLRARVLRALAQLAFLAGAVLGGHLLTREEPAPSALRRPTPEPPSSPAVPIALGFLPALALWLLSLAAARRGAGAPTAPGRPAERPTRSRAPAAPRPAGPPPRWLGPGQPTELAGRPLPGGLVYVGTGLAAVADPANPEPALLDPTLPVAAEPEREPRSPRHALSYTALSPAARASYLAWLAGGRREPRAPAAHPLLFLFGLERRLLHDAEPGPLPPAEPRAIADELRRLLALYADERAFRGPAESLLDYLTLRFLAEGDEPLPPPAGEGGRGLPARLRLALGRRVERGEPIPAALALAWLRHDDEAKLPSAARRAPEEFEALFRRRLPLDFGIELGSRRARTELTVTYQPVNPGFGGRSATASLPLPDVTRWRKPVEELAELARICGEELAGYVRWQGRNPDARPDLAALSHLPAELLAERDDPPLEALRALLARAEREVALVGGHELLRLWPLEPGAKPTKRDCAELARLVGRLGYALEPDVRFGGARLAASDRVALFRPSDPAHHAPSEPYAAATVVLHLAAFLSARDAKVGEAELAAIEAWIERHAALPAPERERLHAHLALLLAAPVERRGLRRRVRALSAAQRAEAGRLLVGLACADGRVEPDEVRALEAIYGLLELDPARVHADLHGANADAPVSVRPARPDEGARAIPPPPEEAVAGLQLDGALVRRKLAETAKVSALLQDIFDSDGEEEDDEVEREPVDDASDEAALANLGELDAPHSALLRALAARASWPRDEAHELARRHGLMPEGALDTLNDEAFRRCDAPLWEGEDPLEIDPVTAEELLR